MRRILSLLGVGAFAVVAVITTPATISAQLLDGNFTQPIVNDDMGWEIWIDRNDSGDFSVTVEDNIAKVRGSNYNGGIYQVINVLPNTPIQIVGNWASNPTIANDQWSEVILREGDYSATLKTGVDVLGPLLYKNDTFNAALQGGWSGPFSEAIVTNDPLIEPALSGSPSGVVTLILKSGSGAPGLNGTDWSSVQLIVPEPSTWLLVGLGSVGLLPLVRHRLRRRSA